jgi:tetratricopeptide (TPR) repeat protein
MGDLIADAQLNATNPDPGASVIAFMNQPGIRADLIYGSSPGGEAPGDITYSLAYSGLTDCYTVLPGRGIGALAPKETMPKATAAAQKALELDDSLAEAHIALGSVKLFYDWDRQNAEKEFQEGIRLDPNYATAFFRYATCWDGSMRQSIKSKLPRNWNRYHPSSTPVWPGCITSLAKMIVS